jgi:chromosome segregation ATPase
MAVATGTALIVAGAVTAAAGATTGGIAANRAKKARIDADEEAAIKEQQLQDLIDSRPELNNPYDGLQNQFANLNNPYANLTVATEAFKQQAEQADMALANSLDIMQEQGMGAGGATALAQAALQSKRGIAASINAQETKNKQMAAEGEANVNRLRAEGAQKLDLMRAQGDLKAQEDAINFHEALMDRTASQMDNAQANAIAYEGQRMAAIGQIGSSIAQGAGIVGKGIADGDITFGKKT